MRPSPHGPGSAIPPAPEFALLDEAVVIAHDQLGFDLLHRIHGDANHNQKRSAAEIEGDVQTFEHEAPHVIVKPHTYPGQVLQMDAGDHPLGQEANHGQIEAADKREAAQDLELMYSEVHCGPDEYRG